MPKGDDAAYLQREYLRRIQNTCDNLNEIAAQARIFGLTVEFSCTASGPLLANNADHPWSIHSFEAKVQPNAEKTDG